MTETPPAALTLHGVTKTYGRGAGEVHALRGIDLTFPVGTFTAVMGPSGSGKSTLLNCAAGLEPTTSGRVVVAGDDITGWDETALTRLRRDRLGFVFQSFHLLPYLTAAENVELPRRLAGHRPDRRAVHALLNRLGLAERARALPSAMSGGQQQRVALARALAADPAVIMADEPTGALDSRTAREVLGLFRAGVDGEVDGNRRTVVMVTHDPMAASFADEVVFLVDGAVSGALRRPTVDAVAERLAHLGEAVA